jgi:A/G-specific adenine glycosylase
MSSATTQPNDAHIQHVRTKILDWYAVNARKLPWREPETTPWGVLVSEVMLQQTQVSRVWDQWLAWMQRWPGPADLAAAETSDVLIMWGRLGYPRRALRLQETAKAVVRDHNGQLPSDPDVLRQLPGIGEYTAAAVASFAFGIPEVVIDTNVRRVHARIFTGEGAAAPSLTAAERRLAKRLMPETSTERGVAEANTWNVATMELGALICTARAPLCEQCPVVDECAWVAAGKPEPTTVAKSQSWNGSDRQVRGAIMGVLRAQGAVDVGTLRTTVEATGRLGRHVPEASQWERAVSGLIDDGLAVLSDDVLALP